jgi:GAF domain-containing protein
MSVSDGANEFDRLQSLRRTGVLSSQPLPELNDICQRTRERFHVPMALVKLVDTNKIFIKAKAGTDLEEVPRFEAFSDYSIRSDEVFVVPDATKDPRFATNPLVTGDLAITFYAGAPLVYERQIRLGSLSLFDTKPREFSLGDRAELAEIGDLVVNVIERYEFANSAFRAGL